MVMFPDAGRSSLHRACGLRRQQPTPTLRQRTATRYCVLSVQQAMLSARPETAHRCAEMAVWFTFYFFSATGWFDVKKGADNCYAVYAGCVLRGVRSFPSTNDGDKLHAHVDISRNRDSIKSSMSAASWLRGARTEAHS